LHFGADELLWECKEKVACESFLETIPKVLLDISGERRQPLYDMWPEIIYRYTSAKLTYGKDKLVALSGIARATKDEIARSNDYYVAGMWRGNLEMQLWWTPAMGLLSSRPRPNRAPTWSWASIDGPVIYPSMRFEKQTTERCAHVLDVNVTPIGADPFGQIDGGVLKLGFQYMLLGTQENFDVIVSLPRGTTKFFMSVDTDDNLMAAGNLVYMIPIAQIVDYHMSRKTKSSFWKGIVVRPTDFEEGQCSRVGSFSIGSFDDSYEEVSQAIDEVGIETARNCCAEIINDPEETFVLSIV
jgi:hypothetical protein